MADRSDIIAKVAANFATITSLAAIHAPAALAPSVSRVPEALEDTPALVLLPGDSPVIPGNWERQTWQLRGSVWVSDTERGERLEALTDMTDLVLAAVRAPFQQPTSVDDAVQSLILTGFDAITRQQWQSATELPWYLVLPFTLELKINRPVTYGPA